jgi:AmmeMemoRadiSam system protein B
LAIESILSLDPDRFIDTVLDNSITLCGVLPISSLLVAANQEGKISTQLAGYNTSGHITGDYNQVVGYAGIIFTKEE